MLLLIKTLYCRSYFKVKVSNLQVVIYHFSYIEIFALLNGRIFCDWKNRRFLIRKSCNKRPAGQQVEDYYSTDNKSFRPNSNLLRISNFNEVEEVIFSVKMLCLIFYTVWSFSVALLCLRVSKFREKFAKLRNLLFHWKNFCNWFRANLELPQSTYILL